MVRSSVFGTRGCVLVATITALGVVVLDLATKAAWFAREEMWTRLSPAFQTVHHQNYGLLANVPAPRGLIIAISLLTLGLAAYVFRRPVQQDRVCLLGMGLLMGGALGNLYDRVMLGFVRDWLLAFERSAFNIADIAIAMGILLMVWRTYALERTNELKSA